MYPLELNKVKNTKNLYFPTCDNVSTLSYHMTLYTTMYPFELDKVKKLKFPTCDNVATLSYQVTLGTTMYPFKLIK